MKMFMTYQKKNYRTIHVSTGEQIQRQLQIHLVIKIRILQTEQRMTVKSAYKCKSKGYTDKAVPKDILSTQKVQYNDDEGNNIYIYI